MDFQITQKRCAPRFEIIHDEKSAHTILNKLTSKVDTSDQVTQSRFSSGIRAKNNHGHYRCDPDICIARYMSSARNQILFIIDILDHVSSSMSVN